MKRLTVGIMLMLVTGCVGGGLKPTDTDRKDAKEMERVQEGTIVQVIDVTIRGNTEIAQAVGAGVGGYAANRATTEEEEYIQILATAAGAAAGSVVGDVVSDFALDKTGVNLIVKLDNGSTVAITQQRDRKSVFTVDKRVWIIGSGKKVRVLPQR